MNNISIDLYPPQIITYTDDLPEHVGGTANAFFVKIRPKYRQDAGLHAHESRHVLQWWAWVLFGGFLSMVLAFAPQLAALSVFWPLPVIWFLSAHQLVYKFVPAYRLWSEVDAYRVQQTFYDDDRSQAFAEFISSGYSLKVTPEQALARLKT